MVGGDGNGSRRVPAGNEDAEEGVGNEREIAKSSCGVQQLKNENGDSS